MLLKIKRYEKHKTLILLFSFVISLVSCDKEEIKELSNEVSTVETINSFELQDGVLKFNSLEVFLEATKEAKELGEENYYNTNIKPLLSQNYKPLRPYFSDDEALSNYLKEKYPDSLSVEDVDLDDSIIIDPAFQVLLNENRQVIVGSKLYIYKINGVYITDLSKNTLKSARISLNQDTLGSNTTFVEMDYKPEISHDYSQENNPKSVSETNFISKVSSVNEELDFNTTSSFSYDKAGSGGLLGPVFGFTKETYVYTPNSKRVKIKYWDRNWIFFQSKGVEVRFQKKKRILWTTVWQKSYPTKVALGFNHITYEAKTYNTFDWDAFNRTSGRGLNDNGLTYIYNNSMYNENGIVKPSLPTGFSFPIQNILNADDFPIQIYYMWNNIRKSMGTNITEEVSSLINKKLNKEISGAISKLKSKGVKENTPVKFFDFSKNSMSYSLANINNSQKDNAITKYLDFGVLVSVKLKGDNFSKFNISSKPLNLFEVKSFDMYGAALYNGVWYGKRIIGYNK